MDEEILERVKRLLERRTSDEQLKSLSIDFFGGEPLMGFDRISRPVLEYAKQLCVQRGKELTVHFTTNGTLFSSSIIDFLTSLDCTVSFQITLDGNRDCHDKVRKSSIGKPTFGIIVRNIKKLIRNGFAVNCRFNYTAGNIYSFPDVATDFEDLTKEERKNLTFTLQQVWQDQSVKKIPKEEEKVINWFLERKFNVSIPSQSISRRCYADQNNSVIISYDGNLYKCTARDFTPNIREGVLTSEGELEYNDKYNQRMAIKFGGEYCQQCSIYPICHGNCSQQLMEKGGENSRECLFGYDEKAKMKIIQERLKVLLNRL